MRHILYEMANRLESYLKRKADKKANKKIT